MATATWTGAASNGDWSDSDNWSGGGGTGGVPAAADDVIIAQGDRAIDTGLTAFAAIAITSLRVTPGFKHSIGSGAGAVQFDTITSLNYAGGGGFCKIDADVTTAKITLSPSASFYCSAGTWTLIEVSGGTRLYVEASAVATTVRSNGAYVEAAANGTGFTTVEVSQGATVDSRRNAGTIYSDGNTIWRDAATISSAIRINSRARHSHLSSGTIASCSLLPYGGFYAAGSPADSFTITTLNEWGGSMTDIDDLIGTDVTVSTRNNVGPGVAPPSFSG